jgi:hypothetical protein
MFVRDNCQRQQHATVTRHSYCSKYFIPIQLIFTSWGLGEFHKLQIFQQKFSQFFNKVESAATVGA